MWEFRVPLFGRDHRVRAWALVDEEDLREVLAFRWSLNGGGYAVTHNRAYKTGCGLGMHRFLFRLERGDGLVVDHINRDKLDNRRVNLRVTDTCGNLQNVPAVRGTSSPYRGVSWSRGAHKWLAQCKTRGRTHHLGVFDDELEAAAAARAFRLANLPGAVD